MQVFTAAIETMLTAIFAAAFIWLMAAVLPQNRTFLLPCAILYVCLVLYITLFSRVAAEEGPTYHGVFRPILGVYMNILMFAPLGFLFKCFHENTATWKIVVTGFIVSLSIEVAQMIFHLGMFETDDLLTNTLGTWAGTVIYRKRMRKI